MAVVTFQKDSKFYGVRSDELDGWRCIVLSLGFCWVACVSIIHQIVYQLHRDTHERGHPELPQKEAKMME